MPANALPITRRALWLAAALLTGPLAAPASAEGYVMGAGTWACGDVTQVAQAGNDNEVGQLAGWIMGFWSSATFTRETGFVDTVESVGGRGVFDATLAECAKAPPETLLHIVVQSMIRNTK